MRFRQRMIGLVTVGLLVSTTVSVGVVAAEDPSLAKSMRFRESVGFPFDTATVAKVAADPAADRAFGVALTAAEAANLRARIAVQDEIGDVVDYINRDPRSFGHVWLDQKDGGAVVLQSRGAPDDAIRKAKGLAPDGATVRVDKVEHSAAELNAVFATVNAALPGLQTDGYDVVQVAIDVPGNLVEIGLGRYSDALASDLAAKFGPMIKVVAVEPIDLVSIPTSCTSRAVCPPRAGLGISDLGHEACTEGFWVRRTSGLQEMLMTTAGHCWSPSFPSWYLGRTTTYYIGTKHTVNYYSGMSADAMSLSPGFSVSGVTKNVVYELDNNKAQVMSSTVANANQVMGTYVCKSGATTSYGCGYITRVDATIVVDNLTQYHAWQANVGVGSGDSGGPVYIGSREFGLVKAAQGGSYMWYSTIDWVNSVLGTRSCLTASC